MSGNKKKKSEFKVGDEIVCSGIKKGASIKAKIVNIGHGFVTVKTSTGNLYDVFSDEIQQLGAHLTDIIDESEAPKNKSKFKVGDNVVVTEEFLHLRGSNAKVIDVKADGFVTIKTESGQAYNIDRDRISLLQSEKSEHKQPDETSARTGFEPQGYRVGARVQVTKDVMYDDGSEKIDVPKGLTGTITGAKGGWLVLRDEDSRIDYQVAPDEIKLIDAPVAAAAVPAKEEPQGPPGVGAFSDEDLESLLEEKQTSTESIIPTEILITKGAREKARILGPLVAKLAKKEIEWYGFLLGNKNDPQCIIRDILIAEHDASAARVYVAGTNVAKAAEEVEKMNAEKGTDYHIIGWVHNHGVYEPHHSPTDKANFKVVANSVTLNTERACQASWALIESRVKQTLLEDKIAVSGEKITDGSMEYLVNDDKAATELLQKYGINPNGQDPKKLALNLLNDILNASKLDIKLPKLVGLAYSVVVNNKDAEPYCEIYVIEEDPLTKKKIEYNKENISLKPIEADNDIEFTEKELEAEVRKKIKFPQPHQPKPQPRQQTASKKWLKDLFSWPFGDSWRVHREQDVPEKAQPRKFEKPGDLENLDIKKLTNAFAKGFIEYASSKEDYSAFMEKVLTTMLSRGGGLVDAIKSAGGKQENGAKCFADLHEYLVAQIAEAALKDATGEKKNMPLLEFMLNFVNNSKYDQSEVIERYVPNFLGVNPIVTEFAYHVIEVVDTRSSIPRYRGEWDKAYTSWLCKVVSRILKENATLEEAILNVGEAKPNSVLGGSDVWFYRGERKKFLQKVMAGKYDDAALNFMNLFNNPATRDTAIVNYAHSVIENYTKSEQDEIDALVENKGNETEKKDDGSK